MSDESPPRKVTSLRDRIAQFEQKPGAPAPPPKPAVPKKTWAWKEKQAEAQSNPPPAPAPAPAQPAASASSVSVSSWSSVPSSSESHPNEPDSNPDHTPVVNPGFSAADAKAAISAGGGLKARLAALQGAGLAPVGDPAASVPPPPPAGKPRVWKKVVVPYEPPPKQDHVLHSLPHDDHPDTTEAEGDEAHPVEQEAQEETTEAPEEEAHAAGPDATAKQAEEPDDEAEAERQRRAAIAARMARLGGARVGMPIAFGKPPVPTPPRRDSGQEVQPAARVASPLVAARKPSLDESVAQRESVVTTETEMTTEGSTAERSTTEEEQEPIAPLPSSPPRPRPPIPATRSWSQSPPASPKTALRPEVISQEEEGVAEVTKEVEGLELQGAGGAEVSLNEGGKGDDEGASAIKASAPAQHADDSTTSLNMTALDSARPSPTSPSLSPSYVPRGGVPLPAIPRRAPPPRRKMPTPKPSSEAVPQAPSGSSGSIEQQGVKASTESLEIQQTETPAATEPTENPLEKATEGVEETHDEAEIHPPIEEPAHTEVKSEEGDAKYDQLVGEEHAAAEPSVPIEPEEEESHYDPEPKVEVKDQKVEKKEATGGDVSD